MPDYSGQLARARNKSRKKPKTPKKKQNAGNKIPEIELFLVGSIGIINDLCDWIGLDLILFRLLDLTTAGILGLWCLTRLRKFPGARFSGTFFIELMPILGDLSPTWTIFIISIYLEQKGSSNMTSKSK